MCGRFTLKTSAPALIAAFDLPEGTLFPARYNIAPAQPVAVVRQSPGQAGRELASLVWGLVPSWSKEPASGFINARAETAAEKPAFRTPFRRRRCLVLGDGFYEWKKNGKKQPYYFQLQDGRPFAFAGRWDRWEGRDGEIIESAALLTTEANGTVRPVHHRMPMILKPEDYAAWLDPDLHDAEALRQLLRPYPADAMMACPVSTHVNSPRHEGPECIRPVEAEKGLYVWPPG